MDVIGKFRLGGFYKGGKMTLSVYLNTEPESDYQKRDVWKIHLKNGLRDMERNIRAVGHEQEIKEFEKVKAKVEHEIGEQQLQMKRSVILFANHDAVVLEILQVPVKTSFYWRERPVTKQLEKIVSEYPRTGIIVVDHEHAVIIDVELGELMDEFVYKMDVDSGDWRRYQGVAATNILASSSSNQEKLKKRSNVHHQRMMKELGHLIDKYAGNRGWKGIYLVGSKDTTNQLQSFIRTPVNRKVPRNLASRSSHDVMKEILKTNS